MNFTKETPVRDVVIQEHIFKIPAPFNEGHTCSGSEAQVLNQTLAENVRNNMAKRIKESVDAGTFDPSAMQAEIDEYLEEYEFGARRGRGPIDPIEREALIIAKDEVKAALRRNGYKLADIDTADINRLAEQVVEENPDVRKEAERRVKEKSKIGNVKLDLGGLNSGEEAQA